MKFWQKIFLPVFILFLVFFNAGMAYCVKSSYEIVLENEKITGYQNAFYILLDLEEQLRTAEKNGFLNNEVEKRIYLYYGTHYLYRTYPLYVYKDGKLKYTNNEHSNFDLQWEGDQELNGWLHYEELYVKHVKDENHEYWAYKGVDDIGGKKLIIAILYPIDQCNKNWKNQIWRYYYMEITILIFLFFGLMMIIRQKTKPIVEISEAANQITNGDYSKRIKIVGHDEVSMLASAFNNMSIKVETQIEDLKQSAAQKQRFIDNLGHELRTPLTSISGYAQYLMMAEVTEEEKYQYLSYINEESHRLLKLSETLLDLAVMKKDCVERGWIQVSHFQALLENTFNKIFEENNINFLVDINVQVLYSNEELLFSLCSNLIVNGFRACKTGGTVKLSIDDYKSMERKIEIKVSDDGIGLSESDISKIMEPFYRVDKDRSRENGGVGLGTTLCKQIVCCLDGTISYESELGSGTIVTVIL